MDEYLDSYLSSSWWSDVNALERSDWECGEGYKLNGIPPISLGELESNEKNSHIGMMSSGLTTECLGAQNASSITFGGKLDYTIDSDLCRGAQLENDSESYNENSSIKMLNGPVKGENMAEYVIGDFGGNRIEPSETQGSFRDLTAVSCVPQVLPKSDDDVFSLSDTVEAGQLHEYGLQGASIENAIKSSLVEMNKILQLDNLSASITPKDRQDFHSNVFPASVTNCPVTGKTVGAPSLLQASSTPTSCCDGTTKPRVRARRGQATDPHSIAERLRREKIAERMKNLQQLVPNSSKTDKASMLDEIIEYVKFLQLQVKVLSMSRLGAAEAVVPLVTDGHFKASNGFSLSPSGVQGVEFSASANQIAFEQEVVKLMESDVSMAMQHLQSKGVCLMPIALATAISRAKGCLTETPGETDKSGFVNGLVQNKSSSSSNSSLS